MCFFHDKDVKLLNENLSQNENMLSLSYFILDCYDDQIFINGWATYLKRQHFNSYVLWMCSWSEDDCQKFEIHTSLKFGKINLLKSIFSKSDIKSNFLKDSKTSHVHVLAKSWKFCLCHQVTNHKIMQIFMGRKIIDEVFKDNGCIFKVKRHHNIIEGCTLFKGQLFNHTIKPPVECWHITWSCAKRSYIKHICSIFKQM